MKMKVSKVLFILVLVSATYGINLRIDPLVLTDQGLIRGQRAVDGDYSYFLGIPYARIDPENPFGVSCIE